MSDRKKILINAVKIGALGLCYYLFIIITGISIPCPLNFITKGKIKCPGCGITRMCLNLLKGNFSGAFQANPCLFILLPVWLIFIAIKLIFQPQWLDKDHRVYNIIVKISVVVLLIFGVLRNIIHI